MKTGKQQVDAYIAAAPRKAQPMLRQLRRIIRTCAPEADERLSYRMPYYSLDGRLAYFAAFASHVSFFVMVRGKQRFAARMKPYQTSPSTLRFPIGTRLPVTLLKALVIARAKELKAAKG